MRYPTMSARPRYGHYNGLPERGYRFYNRTVTHAL